MKDKIFIGDIHYGKRFPYTTRATQARFEDMHDSVLQELLLQPANFYQVGDLFDTYTTSDITLMRGYAFLSKFNAYVLAGNHDKSTNANKPSALFLLKEHLNAKVVWGTSQKVTLPGAQQDTVIWLQPHCQTQQDFEESLQATLEDAKAYRSNSTSDTLVLALHCNYGDQPGAEIENYLRTQKAAELTKVFDLVISGHEHNHSVPIPRLVMLGSILPFSFSEMEDKFVFRLDRDSRLLMIPTWKAEGNYRKVDATTFLEFPMETYQFIEVVGQVAIEQAVAINKKITHLYKTSERLIAIKNGTELHNDKRTASSTEKPEDWVTKIRAQLEEAELSIFDEIHRSIQ